MTTSFLGRWVQLATVLLLAITPVSACRTPEATPQESLPVTQMTPVGSAPPVPQLRRLAVGVSSRSASNLVQFIGMDHGIYARYGFEVELQQLRSNIAPAALLSSQLDYFTGVDSAFRAAIAGNPIKVIAVSRKAPVFGLAAKPEIQSVQELKGRVIGTSARGGSNFFALKRLLEVHGMSIDDVEILVVGDAPVQLQNLLQGTIEATNLSAPAIFEATDRGYRMLAYVPDHVPAFASTGLVASDDTIRSRREEARRLIAASIESARFIRANRDQSIAALARHFEISTELAARTYDFEAPAITADPRMSLEEIHQTIQEEIEIGHVREAPPPERLVALDLIQEAMALVP